MKGKIGASMQGIEVREPKTFNGGKAVYCKDCKHLVFSTGNIKMSSTVSNINNRKRQIYPYVCEVKNIGLLYTSKVVCKQYEKK